MSHTLTTNVVASFVLFMSSAIKTSNHLKGKFSEAFRFVLVKIIHSLSHLIKSIIKISTKL